VDIVHGSAFYRPELVAHATTEDERDLLMPATKTTAKAAPKAKPTIDKAICRWGHGRYHSPATAKDCTAPKAPKKELCADHEKAMRDAIKAARAKATPVATSAPSPKVTAIRRPPKAPAGHAPQRVAAMVAPEVTITKK
jgi:hypothetical protein